MDNDMKAAADAYARSHLDAYAPPNAKEPWNPKRIMDLAAASLNAWMGQLMEDGLTLHRSPSSGNGISRYDCAIHVDLRLPYPEFGRRMENSLTRLSDSDELWALTMRLLDSELGIAGRVRHRLWGEERFARWTAAKTLAKLAAIEGAHCRREGVPIPEDLLALQARLGLGAAADAPRGADAGERALDEGMQSALEAYARAHFAAHLRTGSAKPWDPKRIWDLVGRRVDAQLGQLMAAGLTLYEPSGPERGVRRGEKCLELTMRLPMGDPTSHGKKGVDLRFWEPQSLLIAQRLRHWRWGQDHYVRWKTARIMSILANAEGEHCRREGIPRAPALLALQERAILAEAPAPKLVTSRPARL